MPSRMSRSCRSTTASSTSSWLRGCCTTSPTSSGRFDEIVRVLWPAGRLGHRHELDPEHLKELRALVGVTRTTRGVRRRTSRSGYATRFAHIDERDAAGTVTFADRDAVAAYVQPSLGLFGDVGEIPELTALSSSRGGR